MIDDLARDLDAINVPSIPNDYASLKALIQTLPSPLSPEIRSAASGLAAGGADSSMAGSTSLGASSSPLAGAPVGQESGAGMGRYPELFYGQSNALPDPTFEKLPLWTYPTSLVEGVWTACGPNWEGRKTLTSGTNPAVTVGMGADREWASRDYGSGSSAMGHITVTPAAAACVSVIELRTTQGWSPRSNSTLLTNIVNAVRACNYNGGSAGFSYVVEVLLTGDADVVRASSSITSATLGVGSLFRRLWCSYAGSPGALTSEIWHFVVRLTVTYTSTFSPIQGIYLSEPQMSFSTTEQPPPFTPLVAGWIPRELDARTAHIEPIDAASSYMGWWDVRGDLPATESALRLRLAADTHGRVVVGLASAFGSGIGFGPGGAGNIDVALKRQAAGTVKISTLNSTADEALMIGDDSILFDVDMGDRLGICGQTAGAPNANGGFVFGSGKDTNLYRGGADVLKTDDSLVVGAKLITPASTAQTVVAGTAILANASVIQINSAGGVTMTAVPTIADGVDGQLLTILNVDSADTIILQDQGTLGSSNLRLTGTTVGIGPRDSIQLMYSSTIGDWVQIGALVSVL